MPTRDLDAMKRSRDAGAGEIVVLLPRSATKDEARAVVERLGERLIVPVGAP